MSRSWSKGSTSAWRKVRAGVLSRDQHQCQLRLPGCTQRAEHVHHTRGKAHGDDPAHLVAACASCNLKAGEPTADPPSRSRTRW